MGVYYTCDFCGTQGKGEYFCKCHAKESERVQKVRKNSTIVDQVILHEPEGFLLFEKLVKNDVTCCDEVFYILFSNGKFSFSSYETFAEAKRQLKREKSFSKCKCKPFVMCAGCVSRATTFEISKDPEFEDSEVMIPAETVVAKSEFEKAFDLVRVFDKDVERFRGELVDQNFLRKQASDPEFAKLTLRIADVAISEAEKQISQNVVMSTEDINYFLDLWLEDEEADDEIISEEDFEATCKWINICLVANGSIYKSGVWASYQKLVRDQGKISYCENEYASSIKEIAEMEAHAQRALGKNMTFQRHRRIFRETEFPVDENTGRYIPPLH